MDDAVHELLSGDPESGYDEFLKRFTADAEKPSEEKPEAKEDEKPEEKTEDEPKSDESPDEGAEEESSEEETTEEKEEERNYADDGAYVKIKVDGKMQEVAVKDLSRLWGQEASLTQKSQQVAQERQKVEAELAKNTAATQALLQRAKARFEPYQKVDFVLAAQQLSPQEYTALREEAVKAYEDVQFLEQHLGAHMQQIQDQQNASLRERATATLKELGGDDPALAIEGWNEKYYNDLRDYAVTKLGVPPDVMNNLVDGWGIRILNKAMLYDKGKSNNVVVKKVNKTPKKVVKTTNTPQASKSANATGAEKAMAKLRKTGSQDDAVDAFLARWDDDN